MAKQYPKEFRDDVVAVARSGQALKSQMARDFGISEQTLSNWLKKAEIEEGTRSGMTEADRDQMRESLGGGFEPMRMDLPTGVPDGQTSS